MKWLHWFEKSMRCSFLAKNLGKPKANGLPSSNWQIRPPDSNTLSKHTGSLIISQTQATIFTLTHKSNLKKEMVAGKLTLPQKHFVKAKIFK